MVWDSTIRFLEMLVEYRTDTEVSERILRHWIYPIMDQKLAIAYEKLCELLEVHQEHPMTTNYGFMEIKKTFQEKRNNTLAKERLAREFSSPDQTLAANDVTRIVTALELKADASMDLIAAEDAFDSMQAYYEVISILQRVITPITLNSNILQVAMKLFADNVPSLVIHASVLRKMPEILSPTSIGLMDDSLVARIAGETEQKAQHRLKIARRLETLEAGARTCKQYVIRTKTCK